MVLTENELLGRAGKRNIGEELLAAIRDFKAGRHGYGHQVQVTEAAQAQGNFGGVPTVTDP